MSLIKYDRLYSDSDGRSCVQKNLEIELVARDFVPPAPPIGVSALAPASTYAFLLVPAGFIGDWHPLPSGNGCSISKERWNTRPGTERNGVWGQGATCLQRTRLGKGIEVVS
jgi:hypothetical protein